MLQRPKGPGAVVGPFGVMSLMAVLALLVTACAGSERHSSAAHGSPRSSATVGQRTATPASPMPPTSPQEPLSARIVLPYNTMVAGSSMAGQVVVENNTGHELRSSGCLWLFALGLGNDEISPDAGQPSCLQSFTIPAGESGWPVGVSASYSECGGGVRRCVHGYPPPYPPGDYLAMLVIGDYRIPDPTPIAVRVLPPPAVTGGRLWRH